MKRNFLQVKDWLEANFPELRGKITGDNYPPPPVAELALRILSVVQLLGIVMVFLGSNVFTMIGFRQPPSWYHVVEKNGIQLAIVLYLLIPQILSKWMITGAFEIILDGDMTIFSKLETGRLPQYADLVNPLVKAGLTKMD